MKAITCLPLLLALAAPAAESIQGEIKLNYSESMSTENAIKKEFGNVVKATTSW